MEVKYVAIKERKINVLIVKGKSTVDKNRIKVYKNIYTCIFIKYVYFLFSNNFL